MTAYRLYPSSPVVTLVSYAGPFQAGIDFEVTSGGMWFEGYWWYCPAGGDTGAQEFCLFAITSSTTQAVVPGTDVTSGTLTAGQWNFIPLSQSVPLAIGTHYKAATGWSAVNGFPDNSNQFGAGQPFAAGITSGPLFAWSDQGASAPVPYGMSQGSFGTGTAGSGAGDIKNNVPHSSSNSANFGIDVQVSGTAPAGYAGTYRLWPNSFNPPNQPTTADTAANYGVATELALSQACTCNTIWYYSPPAATQLATSASIWSITSPGTSGTKAGGTTSPSWSGAAGSGWVSCAIPRVTLPAGKYKVSVFNGAGTPGVAFAKDASSDLWRNGVQGSGISGFGPISAPGLSTASTAYNYDASAPGSTPPFTDGTTLPGQSTFSQGIPEIYPVLFAPVSTPTAGSTQNYWVDIEVTPVTVSAGLLMAGII